MRKRKPGPSRDYEMVRKVMAMRKEGLSYWRIAERLDKHVKTVFRWAKYAKEEGLSTPH